jgi:hypothetical protein
MKVPGRVWVQFETLPRGEGTLLTQTAYSAPRSLAGLAYRYGLYPVHGRIFSGMIAALAAEASRSVTTQGSFSLLGNVDGRHVVEAPRAPSTQFS